MRTERKFYERLEMLIEEDYQLKEKAKGNGIGFNDTTYEIYYRDFIFNDEEIWWNDKYCIAENRTPEQCYIFLRSIIL